jgi:hypothetical protein
MLHYTLDLLRACTCLQVLLRHRETGRPPPLALTRQLQAQLVISSRGAYQWQQQLMAALADARLAAAAAAGDDGGREASSSSCFEVLAEVVREFDPHPNKVRLYRVLGGVVGCCLSLQALLSGGLKL